MSAPSKPTICIPEKCITKRDSLTIGALVMQELRATADEDTAQAWRTAQAAANNWDEWLATIAPFATLDVRAGYVVQRRRR